MSAGWVVLLSAKAAEDLLGWASWGYLDLQVDDAERVIVVTHFSDRNRVKLPVTDAWKATHYLSRADIHRDAGVWYHCDESVVDLHAGLLALQLGIATDELKALVRRGWRSPPASGPMLVVTVSATDGGAELTAWHVSIDRADPVAMMVVDGDRAPMDFLIDEWPVAELADVHVTLVGVGSIGSSAAEVLALSGVGRVSLVDPDRLEQRNLPRHRLSAADLGRSKVLAMRDRLRDRYPALVVDPYPLDVTVHADVMRPLFASSDVVVCTADGVAARRVTNHLARRAGVPAIFAAVLEDGAFGELLRIRNRTGCLLCHRRALVAAGAMDPEPGLELGYGTGNPHRPMTAAPGDLVWMGTVAAKTTIATVLEARGRWHQRLPGDYAVVGLQPVPDMARPFNIQRSSEMRWQPLPASSPDCPTCTPP